MYLQKNLTWRERQVQITETLQMLEEKQNAFEHPCVVTNPYGIAPLTALILFETSKETGVQVTISAPDDTLSLQYTMPSATKHRVPIYGLYADTANRVVLTLDYGEQCEVIVQTDPLPEQLASAQTEGTMPDGQWMFTVPLAGCSLPAAYDANGICRWYCTEELAYQISPTKNGRILTCGPALLSPPYSATAIWEMDLLGRIHREYRIPGGVCNGFFELENGNLLALHQFFNRGTAADLCVEIDRVTGAVIKEWDFRKLLPMTKGGSPGQSGSDWMHGASIWYDRMTDSITVAAKHQDSMVNIGYTSGALNWILGDPTGWPQELVESYFLMPADDTFTWSYEPEWAQMLPNHQLLCFDNGHLRTKKGGTPLPLEQRYSRVVCYQIDTEHKTVQEVWAYGKDAGHQLYSPYMGNCLMQEDGVCLMNFGGIGFLQGSPAEPPAYFVQKDHPDVAMQTVILLQKGHELLYRMQLPINCYHACNLNVQERIGAVVLEAGEVLGSWHGNDLYDLDMEWEDAGLIGDEYRIEAELTSEQLIVSGTFIQGEMVLLILENGEEKRLYYMQTTRVPYLTGSAQTYAKGSERPIRYVVDVTPLSGAYEIYISLDDKKYRTDLQFVCE